METNKGSARGVRAAMKEIVDIKTVAVRLNYSPGYFRNNWPKLLPGIKPIKLGLNRSIRFFWEDIESFLNNNEFNEDKGRSVKDCHPKHPDDK